MGRKKSAISGRRHRVSRHANPVGRRRLRVRQLLARRIRLRSYLQYFLADDKSEGEKIAEKIDSEIVE
ncbi:hypothetical protein ACJJIK_19465 [Microbulbifer sp. ZKSA006]|uniref:hypothetical protein n=1 Tax=Microbulbifer sp. ZKSA006 TaxID=3243390 RepID=UPI0040390F17